MSWDPSSPKPPDTNVTLDFLLEMREKLRSNGNDGEPATFLPEDLGSLLVETAEKNRIATGLEPMCVWSRQTIALQTEVWTEKVKKLRDDKIDVDDWMHHMVLRFMGDGNTRAVAQMKALLEQALERDPNILEVLQEMFEAAEPPGPGLKGLRETVAMFSQRLWGFCDERPSGCYLAERRLCAKHPNEFARQVVRYMTIDDHSIIGYHEFMAFFVGRRRHEVVLYMYDLTKGRARAISRWLPISEQLDGLWHTGLVVFGWEYFYCGKMIVDVPAKTCFGVPRRGITVGYTLRKQLELHKFVCADLKPIFTWEKYDILQNNCNHFTDSICKWLCGRNIPEEILRQEERILEMSPVARFLWPTLRKAGIFGFTSVQSVTVPAAAQEGQKQKWDCCSTPGCGMPMGNCVMDLHPCSSPMVDEKCADELDVRAIENSK